MYGKPGISAHLRRLLTLFPQMDPVPEIEEEADTDHREQDREHLLVTQVSAKVGGIMVPPEKLNDKTHDAIKHHIGWQDKTPEKGPPLSKHHKQSENEEQTDNAVKLCRMYGV